MFGHLIFEMNSYYDFVRTLQLLGIIIFHSSLQVFGSFRQYRSAMRTDSIGLAHDPLLPLQRWIQYTQTELRQVRAEL